MTSAQSKQILVGNCFECLQLTPRISSKCIFVAIRRSLPLQFNTPVSTRLWRDSLLIFPPTYESTSSAFPTAVPQTSRINRAGKRETLSMQNLNWIRAKTWKIPPDRIFPFSATSLEKCFTNLTLSGAEENILLYPFTMSICAEKERKEFGSPPPSGCSPFATESGNQQEVTVSLFLFLCCTKRFSKADCKSSISKTLPRLPLYRVKSAGRRDDARITATYRRLRFLWSSSTGMDRQ